MKKSLTKVSLSCVVLFIACFLTSISIFAQPDTTHYVLPGFVEGSVKMKDGRTEIAIMDYNKLTEEMIFEKDGIMLALDSISAIDTVDIGSREFVPHEKVFYEVLVKGPVSLFIQHRCNLIASGNPSGYGGVTETGSSRNLTSLTNSGRAYQLKLPTEYHVTDASQDWIRRNGTFFKANTATQIIKAFPDKSKEIKQFIKSRNLDLKNDRDLVTLIVKCNEFVR
jgi:hypothetical protein